MDKVIFLLNRLSAYGCKDGLNNNLTGIVPGKIQFTINSFSKLNAETV
jgi:hypothetical protein